MLVAGKGHESTQEINGQKFEFSDVEVVKNLIKKDPELPAEDKEKALALLNQDTVEMQEVSKRWQADMKSDSWLSKNTRPLTLVFLTVAMVLLIFIDSTGLDFDVDSGWVDLLKSLLITHQSRVRK